MKYLFVCYPGCSTCARARDWLNAHGIDFAERNIKTERPTREELAQWLVASGLEVRRFFNTSGQKYRELGLAAKLPGMPIDRQLELLASDGMLVRRPLLVGSGRVLAGFRPDEWQQVLKKQE